MNQVETARKLFELIEMKNTSSALEMLTTDFSFSGPTPEPINGQIWMAMHDKLNKAFPDWSFNMTGFHLHGDEVHGEVQISGTHRGDLDLSLLGIPNVPATGRRIQLPVESITFKFQGDKICAVEGESVPGGGAMGILGQIGVQMPVR